MATDDPSTPLPAPVGQALAAAEQQVAAGRVLEAVDELTEANRSLRHAAIERRLVELRHQAWDHVDRGEPRGPWPRPVEDRFPPGTSLPEVTADALSADLVASAVQHHGALLVRGFFPPERVAQLRADIDATTQAVARVVAGEEPTEVGDWFVPFDPPDYDTGGRMGRMWVLTSGTVWTAESPRTFFDLLDAFEEMGFDRLLVDYFGGERPALSLIKCALRRVPPDAKGGWHQDGYVFGETTRALNAWIALTPCGADAPGLDIVPKRMAEMVPTSSAPPLDFIVDGETVAAVSQDAPAVSPAFEPGDAVLFDQFLLHQTGARPDGSLTAARDSFECWFLAPSTYPTKWVPLVV